MDSVSVGNDLDAILMDRYPGIVYHLHFVEFKPFTLKTHPDTHVNAMRESKKGIEFLHAENIDEEIQRFLSSYALEGIEIFYLYGIGLGYHFAALKTWLEEKSDRLLMIIEHDLGAIDACLKHSHAQELIAHPQVHLHYVSNTREIPALMRELIETFPAEHAEIAAIESYAQRKRYAFQKMRLQLYRFTAVHHAVMVEALYSHKLLDNLIKNILKWPNSFFANGLKEKFKGVPAIICGAGPSLANTFEQLKEINDRALIFAGGSTISALSNQGILPHIGVALDPNPEEFGRLKSSSSYEVPLLYATRLEPRVFNTCNGERGYILTKTGGCCEAYFENVLNLNSEPIGPELGEEAFSVTTLCIALAVEMGCDPIFLNGIDLAYTGMQRYAAGVLPSSQVFIDEMKKMKKAGERLLKRKDIFGKPAYTLVKWVMESACIAAYAKQRPNTRFINVTQGGLGFSGIPNSSFAEASSAHLKEQHDLTASLHTFIQTLKMHTCTQGKILHAMREVYDSLLRVDSIAEQMLTELQRVKDDPSIPIPSGKMSILEIDFEEEKAFQCLLIPLEVALESLLNRVYYFPPFVSDEEKRRKRCDRLISKWKQYKQIIENKKDVFSVLLKREATYQMI